MHVLILGARAPACLEWARAFDEAGWTVSVGDSLGQPLSRFSCSVQHFVRLPEPRQNPAAWLTALAQVIQAQRIDLLLPTCEEVFFVSRYRDRLPAQVRVVADDFGKLREVHSKWSFLSLAQDCGVEVPDSALVTSLDEARDWAASRPVVLKPEFSRFGVHVRLYRHGIPDTAPPLASLGNWVVQAYADGREFCSYSVADRGRLVAHSVYQPRWRMSTSSSFYFEAAQIGAIRRFVEHFARKLDFTGQLSFDWIQHADGRVSVLECNPRATSGCHLLTLDDPLPSALDGTLTELIEPSCGAARMVSAVMLSAGLIEALKRGELRRWARDYRIASDVIGTPGDRGPIAGAIRDLVSYARLALAQRCNMREAATQDIEWDGQELPET